MSNPTAPLFRAIASTLVWKPIGIDNVRRRAKRLNMYNKMLPSGSGIDNGCVIDESVYSDKHFVIRFGYHHMKNGFYTHWTRHSVIVTASLASDVGFMLRFTGGGDEYFNEYLNDVFTEALTTLVSLYPEVE